MSILETIVFVLSWIFIISGSIFLIIGAVGILRFPDFWSRLHAAAIIDSAAAGLLFAGMIMQGGFTFVTAKLLLIGIFMFITGPTSTHAVANAAYVSGSRPLGDDSGQAVSSADIVDALASTPDIDEEIPSKS